jgi:hypothetical protein
MMSQSLELQSPCVHQRWGCRDRMLFFVPAIPSADEETDVGYHEDRSKYNTGSIHALRQQKVVRRVYFER